MKTIIEWAEQLPELIRIEFLKEATIQKRLSFKLKTLSSSIFALSWMQSELGDSFWAGIYESIGSADSIDESVPYTKSEVEAMILEYADPNDEVCKVMLANVGKSRVVAPSANAKPIVLDELGQTEARVLDTPKWGELVFSPKEKENIEVSTVSALDYFNLRSDYFGLKKENEALKREVEVGKEKIKKLQEEQFEEYTKHRGVVFRMNDEIMARNETIKIQEETIKTLTQMRVAPKKEQSIFFDLLEHIGLRK